MADKITVNNKNIKTGKRLEVPKKSGGILKIVLILLLLLILAAASFAVGIYLKFIDVQEMTDRWKLNEYPIVGQFFPQPKTNFEPVELGQQNPLVIPSSPTVPSFQPDSILPKKEKIDDIELQKQAKLKQQEEAKRISKIARLYGAMKPDEAVAILNKMDDDTVLLILSKMEDEQVAKILALFDARRAAVLSQSMLRGRSII